MKKEQAQQLSKDSLATLAQSIAAGKSDSLQAYLACAGRFRTYSWSNQMMIWSQNPDATRVAGYQAWRKFGRFVKKGESGIAIFAPLTRMVDDPATGERRPSLSGFRVTHVFDVSQTDGDPLPTLDIDAVTGDPGQATRRLESLAESRGIAIEYVESFDDSRRGDSAGGKIRILATLDPAALFHVLAHEIGHELLHWPKDGDRFARLDKTRVETEAESVAYAVSCGVGLDPGQHSATYVGLYDGNLKALTASLADVQRVSSEILQAILD